VKTEGVKLNAGVKRDNNDISEKTRIKTEE
jgi:hypothetical protein